MLVPLASVPGVTSAWTKTRPLGRYRQRHVPLAVHPFWKMAIVCHESEVTSDGFALVPAVALNGTLPALIPVGVTFSAAVVVPSEQTIDVPGPVDRSLGGLDRTTDANAFAFSPVTRGARKVDDRTWTPPPTSVIWLRTSPGVASAGSPVPRNRVAWPSWTKLGVPPGGGGRRGVRAPWAGAARGGVGCPTGP